MIQLKNPEQIKLMKEAGRITGEALVIAGEALKPGISTKHIDDIIRHHIEKSGAKPSFLGYGGFPGSACISINEEIIHGIPSEHRMIQDGDLVKIDVGAFIHGFHGDSACTFEVGNVGEMQKKLAACCRESFYKGVESIRVDGRMGDVGHAIQEYVEGHGYGVIREYIGHGVGHELHESPDVPNYGTAGRGPRLAVGMTFAIEPMISLGSYEVKVLSNNWTVITKDHSTAAHYEHTIAITENGVELLTKVYGSK